MASKSLGTLTLDLVAQTGKFTSGLDKAAREAKKSAEEMEKAFDSAFMFIGAGFASLATAGAGALAIVNQQAEAIANFQGLAEKVGDTAEAMASLQTASAVSGVSLETVATASVRLNAALADGGKPAEELAQSLGAIGIEFDKFSAMSPVDRIEAVAKALNSFEDGAEKSAIAVQLFGRAGADLIPFFNDLADGSERNIRLTQEQIDAADAYTKQVAHLQDQFNQFIQQQASSLIPVLSDVVKLMSDLAKNEDVVATATFLLEKSVKAFLVVFQTITVVASDVIYVFKQTGQEIGALIAQLAALGRFDLTGFRAISDAVKEDAKRARAELDSFQKSVMSIGQPAYVDDEIRRLQNRSSSANQPASRPRINLPVFGGGGGGGGRRGGGASSDPEAQAKRYLESLQKQLEKTQQLTVADQALLDIQAGRLGKVSEAQKAAILGVAQQIDAAKALAEQEKANNKALEEQVKIREQLVAEGERFTEQFATPQEKFATNIANVNRLLGEGVISLETAARAVQSYRKEIETTKEAVGEFDEFTKNAIKGTQDAFAGFFEGLISGSSSSFKEVASNFAKMITNLVAQAAAAKLTESLFGSQKSGGSDGLLSGLLSSFVSSGGRALGGPVLPNSLYRVNENGPEIFQAANGSQYLMTGTQGGRVNPNNTSVVINQNFAANTSRQTADQAALSASRAIQRSQRNA